MGSLTDAIVERLGRPNHGSLEGVSASESPLALAAEIADDPRTVELPDGRQLGYADVGDPDGDPLFVFHGFPNSRVFGALFDEIAREYGFRIVAPDRPGLGVSDPQPDRALTDWPADVDALAEALDVGTFSVFGVSAGGPHALVTAALLGDRVDRAAVGSGLGPMGAVGLRERLWYYGARYVSPLSKLALWRLMGRAVDDREASLERLAEAGSPADEPLWTGEVGQILHASMVEARRVHGIDPLVTETALLGSPWGFDLADVDVPVGLWYGKADAIVPVRMGLHLTEHLPTAETHVYPDLGHLSAVEHNEDAIFEWLSR